MIAIGSARSTLATEKSLGTRETKFKDRYADCTLATDGIPDRSVIETSKITDGLHLGYLARTGGKTRQDCRIHSK